MTGISEQNQQVIDDFFAKNADPNRPNDQIVCIVDRSGSMGRIKDDAEGGLNHFIEQQKQVPGDADFTLVQFDSEVERVYDRVNLNEVGSYTLEPRASTALLDAIGQTVNDVLTWDLAPETKVIITIVTDGGENSSREYTHKQITDMLDQCRDKDWEVVFLAANQDAMQAGGQLGLAAANTMDWDHSAKGIHEAYATAHTNAAMYRTGTKSAGESVRDYQGKSTEQVVREKTAHSDADVDNNK